MEVQVLSPAQIVVIVTTKSATPINLETGERGIFVRFDFAGHLIPVYQTESVKEFSPGSDLDK